METTLLQVTSYGWAIFCIYWIFAGIKTKDSIKKERRISRLSYLLLLIIAFGLVYWRRVTISFLNERLLPPHKAIAYLGVAISIAGIILAIASRMQLGKNWSGTVTIKKDHELIQSGPYRLVCHPIYTGALMGLAGAALIQCEMKDLIAVIVLVIALHIKMAKEEVFLSQIFPEYDSYKKKTKKIIPFIY